MADELADLHAESVKRRNERDAALVKLRVAQRDRGAEEDRFQDAVAHPAANRSRERDEPTPRTV